MNRPKLRDSRKLSSEIYEIGNFPQEIITKIGGGIVFLLYTGRNDITGDDWGDIFAEAVGGVHLSSPIGIADVVKDAFAWSMKTVKSPNPFNGRSVRLISGRCSPDYSFGILDPHEDVQKTGEAVLAIWNSRVDIALSHYSQARVGVLIRNYNLDEFVLFEEYLEHFKISDYEWRENHHGNLEGFHKITKIKHFVWQPHGSQFTIIVDVPTDSVKFKLKRPEIMTKENALKQIGFDASWIEFV